MFRRYQMQRITFPFPRKCPYCGTPAVKGKGEGGRDIDPDRYGHRYGYFCTLRCGTNYANYVTFKEGIRNA